MLHSLLLPAVTCAAVFVSASQPVKGAQPDTLRNAITAAAIRGYEPHYIIDGRGRISGFAVDVMEWVAKNVDLTVTYQVYDSPEEAVAALAAGRIDLIPNIGLTTERRRIAVLSAPYETLHVGLFIRAGQREVNNFEDLKGRIVGVVSKTTTAEVLAEHHLSPQSFLTLEAALRALLSGTIEVLAYPSEPVRRLARSWGKTNAIQITGPPVLDAERGMLFSASRPSLAGQLEPVLRELTHSARFDQLHRKWFGQEPSDDPFLWYWVGCSLLGLSTLLALVVFYRGAIAAGIADDPEQMRLKKELWRRRVMTGGVFMSAAIMIALITLGFLYRTAFEEARSHLAERAESESTLIEAVARFDLLSMSDPVAARLATLKQIAAGLARAGGEEEVVLIERHGNDIVFLLRQRASQPEAPVSLPFRSELAEAGQLALVGRKGTLVGLDYRGQKVLAAYRPLSGLRLGYVVKKDMSEIQGPFIRAGFVAVAASLLLAVLGVLAYFRVTAPLSRRLLHNESHSRSLFRAMSDGMTTYHAVDGGSDFVVSDVNPAAEELERRSREELVGSRVTELYCRDDAVELLGILRGVWQDGQARQIPPRKYHLQGRPAWRAHKVYRLPSGEVVVVFDDVTEREEALSSLRQSEERFREIAESVREVFWVAESSMKRLLYLSPAFEEVWGLSADTLYADLSRLFETIHPEDRDRVKQAFCAQDVERVDIEYRIFRPDGTMRWIRDRGFAVLDAEGKVNRIVGVAEDVTKQKERESQLLQAQKLDAVGQLTGGIAHDFNNLLQTVLCNANLVRQYISGDKEADELVDSIEDATLSGARLVDNMLAFARRKPITVEEVDVKACIMGMRPLIATLGDDIEIDFQLKESSPPILTDADYLKAAILNLLVNARDAMPRGGTMTVRTSIAQIGSDCPRQLSDLTSGTYVTVEVIDTGCGIPVQDLDRVFEPFYTTKEPGEGTGLGLPMVYGFAKQCGGLATIESALGIGTKVCIYLPGCATDGQQARRRLRRKPAVAALACSA